MVIWMIMPQINTCITLLQIEDLYNKAKITIFTARQHVKVKIQYG